MLSDRVRCQVCGRWLKALAFAHLRRHGMTGDEYKKRYGVDFLVSDTLRVQNSRRHRRSGRSTYEPLHRTEILKRIVDLDARGESLRPTVMTARRQLPLITMAERIFGTWRAAVAAAGVDYAKHIRKTWWNPSKVGSRIRERHRKEQTLTYTAVEREEPSLISAAYYCFGSWARAIKKSGLPASCGRSTRKWSRASIIAEIVRRHSRGALLNIASVQAEFPGLASAALRAAGFDPAKIRERRPARVSGSGGHR